MCKISIIIPVYNVEQYLTKCLESVVSQTLTQIEVIVVNDGSTDSSGNILQDFQRRYPERIKIFTTQNLGVSHARNYGMKQASGDYLMFVDSDDYIEKDMCEKLYAKAVKDNNDLVICARYNVYDRGRTGELEKEAVATSLLNRNFRLIENRYELAHISPFPWDKLYKRSLLKGRQFPENIRFEDLVFAYEVCVTAESIGVVEEPLYDYRRTTQGGFLNSFSEQTLDIIKALQILFDFMEKNGYMELYHEELEYICAIRFMYRYGSLFKENTKGKLRLKQEIIRRTQDFLDTELPGWQRNRYLLYSSGEFKKKLGLYTHKNKMLLLSGIREIMPEAAVRLFYRMLRGVRKIRDELRALKTSGNRRALLKKKLPFLGYLKQSGSAYYTKMYETQSIIPNRILLESKHGEDVAGNIFALLQELGEEAYQEFKVFLAIEKGCSRQFGELFDNYRITHVTMLDIHSKEYLKALASAKYLITDTSFPPFFVKKKEQIYLNTWHGTPLKAMGRVVPKREYALGNIQRNFLIADYLLYQNDFSKDMFLKDYMLKDIYPGTVLVAGYPRNSVFFRKSRYDIIRQELGINHQQVIAYMPTWRGLLDKKESAKQLELFRVYFAELDEKLTASELVYVKLHPYVKNQMDYSEYQHIRAFPQNYETYDFLNASDVLVTDYSSIIFDYAVTKRKIVLFTYDRKEYQDDRGLYLKLDNLELPGVGTVDELITQLRAEHKGYPEFFHQYCSYDSANTPKQVLETILKGAPSDLNNYKAERLLPDGRKKVLLYMKGMKRDDSTRKLIQTLNSVDTKQFDLYVCLKTEEVKEATGMLSLLKPQVNYLVLPGNINFSRREYFVYNLINKNSINRKAAKGFRDHIVQREIRRCFGEAAFDIVFQYSELDRLIGRMCCLLGPTRIYNFQYFRYDRYKTDRSYQKAVSYYLRNFPEYTAVIATREYELLGTRAGNNVLYKEGTVFPMAEVLAEVTQHEGRSHNISQRQ